MREWLPSSRVKIPGKIFPLCIIRILLKVLKVDVLAVEQKYKVRVKSEKELLFSPHELD